MASPGPSDAHPAGLNIRYGQALCSRAARQVVTGDCDKKFTVSGGRTFTVSAQPLCSTKSPAQTGMHGIERKTGRNAMALRGPTVGPSRKPRRARAA